MAKIFYSLSGEGRGHATRVHAIVQMLQDVHEIVLFTYGDAYDFLEPMYRETSVRIVKIPGIHFQYTPDRKLDYLQTGHSTGQYLIGLPWLVQDLWRMIEDECPDLVITDFEPSLPRAAWRYEVPVLSLDHQHFLSTSDFSSLPLSLQTQAALMGLCVEAYYSNQDETVVSSFFAPPLKPRYWNNVAQIGVLLRQQIFTLHPEEGDYLLMYWRKHECPQVLEALKATGYEVRIYGLGEQPDDGNLRYFPVNQQGFIRDLAGCKALISTAGNQLVGEALYLDKPVFAIPEASNYEQYINAHFLNQSGMGAWSELHTVTARQIMEFLERLDTYRACIDPDKVCGNRGALEAIARHLPAASRPMHIPPTTMRRRKVAGYA